MQINVTFVLNDKKRDNIFYFELPPPSGQVGSLIRFKRTGWKNDLVSIIFLKPLHVSIFHEGLQITLNLTRHCQPT